MTRPLHPLSEALLDDLYMLAWGFTKPGAQADTRALVEERLVAIEDAAEQVGRDQWRRASGHGADQWEALLTRLDLFEDADIDTVIAAIRAEATPTVEAHEGPHDFQPIVCSRCGVRGWVNLSIVGEDERLDITKRTPTDADLARAAMAREEYKA